ncbi:MAG: hypothetical protein OEV76_12860, partial [Anaerolineae bacterium]|nr:hypothetical protein [Anaerolineae bacterium]
MGFVTAVLVSTSAAGCSAPETGQPLEHGARIPWVERGIGGIIASHHGDKAIVSWNADQLAGRQLSVVHLTTLEETGLDREHRSLGPGGQWSPDDRYFATVAHTGGWTAGFLDTSTLAWRPIPIPALDVEGTVYTMTPTWSSDGDALVFDAEVDDQNGRPR